MFCLVAFYVVLLIDMYVSSALSHVFVPRILFIYISISICIYFFLLLFVLFCVLLLSFAVVRAPRVLYSLRRGV